MCAKLLLDTQPLVVLPELAVAIGLNEAIVLQQVHYWCELNAKTRKNYKEGHYWVYNSFSEWKKQFPWWSERTIKTIFSKLERVGLLVSGNYNSLPMDRTKWYRVNHAVLDTLVTSPLCKICTMDSANLAQPIPETKIMEKWNLSGYPSDNSPTNPLPYSVPIVECRNEEISSFIDWYFKFYRDTYSEDHPNIKSRQRIRIVETLATFMDANHIGTDALQEMTRAFFNNVEDTDHNINHFATNGILENRYYETVY